ncbi:hypothetical protein CHS0354_026769 [Potamilus streckersoni]|uniref:Glycosyltransferase family 4 protein n=1 Tax=Potamilus streckersoni TaxID=2493646 RepID=A0AAE0W8C7_9BIVA|nr:hypothetical protein CHS0354_026769 [Potamilus streckersoni]
MDFSNLKVAVLHYWLTSYRGGERVVKQILKLFPQADIYTLFADPQICREHFAGHKIYSSFLDKPILRRYYKNLFPLYPMGVEKINCNRKSGPIKGIPNPHGIPHICYIHTPMRYCWGYTEDYLQSIPEPLKYAVAHMFRKLRRWDYTTRDAPDLYIANSKNVRTRVKQYYHKEAEVIYPPVSAYLFDEPLEAQKEKYYLYLGAVTPYKGVNMMIEAFNITRKPLVIASDRAD